VRLIGIDAPEVDQVSWGVQARDALRELLDGKTVRLETDITIRDQYRRLLAYVYVGEMLVNLEMVRQGQAVIYTVPPNVAHVEEYREAQTKAREAGRGVWDAVQPLDIAPDCYRKLKKGREC
jgi:micrococcal nuclease